MWLKSLKIKKFRAFKELEVEFNPRVSLIVGINGSGKTTVLDGAGIMIGTIFNGMDGWKSMI